MILLALCGHCRFACPGALLEQDPDDLSAAPPTAESICDEAGVAYGDANQECLRLSQSTANGGELFHHESCIMDYCGSGGNKAIVDDDIKIEQFFEDEDK